MTDVDAADHLERLRQEFDDSFTAPFATTTEEFERLLFVRVAGEIVALPTRDLAAVLRCPPLTYAPSTQAALLGLASVRGRIVAAYHLGVMLGRDPDRTAVGWIAPWAADRTVALWFDEIVGFEHVASMGTSTSARAVDQHGTPRLLVNVSSMLETMTSQATLGGEQDAP